MLGKFASGARNTAMGNLIYIHFLQQHYNQSGLKGNETPFNGVKFLNDEEGTAASLAQNDYKNALLAKTKLSSDDVTALGFATKQGSQQLLDSLNKAFEEALLNALNFDREEAHTIYREGLGPLNKVAEKVIPTIRDSVDNLQHKFIKPIINIIEAMETGSGNIAFSTFLNDALKNAKDKGKRTSKELLENFLKQLNSSDGSVVTDSEYKQGLEYFKTIMTKVHDFVQDASKTGINDAFKLTNSISQTLQQDLFSTEMGQITAVKRDALINDGLNQVNTALDEVFTGKQQAQNKHYPNNKNTYKTDITIPGKYITLKIEDKEYELSVSLQASVKFLKTQAWTLENDGAIDVDSGSGGSLLEFFDAMKYDQKQRYDIYNYLTFVGLSQPFARIMMQRQLFRLFSTGSDSSTGQKIDFSTHILANGELISIWELFKFINKFKDTTELKLFKQYINFYLQRNLKKTKKLTSRQNVGKTRIKINENWMFLNQWYQGNSKERVRGSAALKRKDIGAAWYRARVVFNDINAAVINATIHLHKIAAYCVKNKWNAISRTKKK